MPTAAYGANGQLLGTRRTPAAIYADLSALSPAQKTNIWNNFTSGSPPLWATDDGASAGAIGIGFGLVANLAGAMTAAQLTDMKIRAVVCYVLDNVEYLIQPAFDQSINVPGYA
jgi:hypothetical protein